MDLRARTATLHAAGRAAWPDIDLDPDLLAQHLVTLGDEAPPTDEHAADLYLACACASGLPTAITAFDQAFLSRLPSYLARMSPSPSELDEIRQMLRERLLVARAGERPRIADYAGRGPLSGWLRVAAVRTALNLRARKDNQASPDRSPEILDDLPALADPELAYLKARYAPQFQQAVTDAFATLSDQERNLLRLYFVKRLTGQQLAATFGVSQSTISRRLSAAQDTVMQETSRLLKERLQIHTGELDSLLRLVSSQLQISLSALRDP